MTDTPQTPTPTVHINMYCIGSQTETVEQFNKAMNHIRGLTPKEFEGTHEFEGVTIKIYMHENPLDNA